MRQEFDISKFYIPEKAPYRDTEGHLVFQRAVELPYDISANFWEYGNVKRKEVADPRDCQIMVLTPHLSDMTANFYQSLKRKPLGKYPALTSIEQEFGDHETKIWAREASSNASSVYIVASILNEKDWSRMRKLADHYKEDLNAKNITLVCPFMANTRQDKNVDKDGNYEPTTISIRTEIRSCQDIIDRMIGLEPHSSAVQSFAAKYGIPYAPLSPWQYLTDRLLKTHVPIDGDRVILNSGNTVIVRPDKGRNLAAVRMEKKTGFPAVSFDKIRISGSDVEMLELTPEEQARVKGKVCIAYDDESETMGTIDRIANALGRYGAKALIALVVHEKFTTGWETKITNPLITAVYGTNSREPIGNIRITDKIKSIPIGPLVRGIIEADIESVNFWKDERFKNMILQPNNTE